MSTYFLKNRIIEYAILQIRENGITGIKVDDISSALGISKKTFYEIFESKTAMTQLCIVRVMEEFKAKISSILEDESLCPVLRFKKLVETYVEFLYFSAKQNFWDFSHKYDLSEPGKDIRRIWVDAFTRGLDNCRDFLVTDTIHPIFIDSFIDVLEKVRQREDKPQNTRTLASLLTRGLFNSEGLQVLDNAL